MANIEIKKVTEKDLDIYSRTKNSKFLPETNGEIKKNSKSKPMQVSSGRRGGFEPKNSPRMEQKSEKKVSSWIPKYENGELQVETRRLDPIKMDSSKRKNSGNGNNGSYSSNGKQENINMNNLEFDKQLSNLNTSPPMQRKDPHSISDEKYEENNSPRASLSSNSGILPKSYNQGLKDMSSGRYIIETELRKSSDKLDPSGQKIVSANKNKQSKTIKKKVVKKKSKRKPESITSKSNENNIITEGIQGISNLSSGGNNNGLRAIYESSTGNKHYSDYSVIHHVDGPKSDRYRNKKITEKSNIKEEKYNKSTTKKKSKHVKKKHSEKYSGNAEIRIGGHIVNIDEMDSSSSKTNSKNSDRDFSSETSNTSETTSRRQIKKRSTAIDKRLKEEFDENELEDDRENLESAIRLALDESRKESIKEALEAGHELNAEILKSVTRPNAIEEVINKMVSNRRERIREKKREVEHAINSSSRKESLNNISQQENSNEKANMILKKVMKNKSSLSKKIIKETIDDEDPLIETIDDEAEEELSNHKGVPVKINLDERNINSKPVVKEGNKLKSHITIDDGVPHDAKKKTLDFLSNDDKEETELLHKKKSKVKRVKKKRTDDSEENVKLPNAHRKLKKGDYLSKPDAIGQQDSVYDPLGVDFSFDDSFEEDDIYEESSEDESKMTIAEKKDDMIYRFRLIKEAYPRIALPRIHKGLKLARIVRLFDHVMAKVKLKVKTNNFKIFLIVGFLIMQLVGKKIGLDTAGFTVNQMYSINRYDSLLRELGESDWTSIGTNFPVMVRLPFYMAVNAGIFIIAKWIFKKTGKDYTVQFHKLYAQLTGGDDYVYIKDEEGDKGLGAGDDDGGGGGGGGMFGIIKSILGMMGGGGGDTNDESRPTRGEGKGPTYKRRGKKKE